MTFNANIAAAQPAALRPSDMTEGERLAAIARHLRSAAELAAGARLPGGYPLRFRQHVAEALRWVDAMRGRS